MTLEQNSDQQRSIPKPLSCALVLARQLSRRTLAVLVMCLSAVVSADPFIPQSETEVLERLTVSVDFDTQKLRRWRTRLAEDPHNLDLAVSLAAHYLQMGRAEGDSRYSGYAQAVLAPWLKQTNPPSQTLFYRALIQQRSHRFDEALEDLARVLRQRPRHAQAWLTRAVILEVRGQYADAMNSCFMLSRLVRSLVSTTCIASVASLNGQAHTSYRVLNQALQAGSAESPQERLWSLVVLAEIAVRLGKNQEAERHFRDALDLGVRDVYLLGAFADFLLDQGRYAAARELLARDTRPDALLLRLALAEQQLNPLRAARRVQQIRERFAAEQARGDALHQREAARFTLQLLEQPVEALRLALENWQVQREPADSRLVLEAALAAGDVEAATPVLQWLEEGALEDVRLATLSKRLRNLRR